MIKLDLRVCVAGAIQAAPLDNHKPFALEYESLLSQGDTFRRVLPLTAQLKISLRIPWVLAIQAAVEHKA
jgi:hypothetical protein